MTRSTTGSRIEQARRSIVQAATEHGHVLTKFKREASKRSSTCSNCGARAVLWSTCQSDDSSAIDLRLLETCVAA